MWLERIKYERDGEGVLKWFGDKERMVEENITKRVNGTTKREKLWRRWKGALRTYSPNMQECKVSKE